MIKTLGIIALKRQVWTGSKWEPEGFDKNNRNYWIKNNEKTIRIIGFDTKNWFLHRIFFKNFDSYIGFFYEKWVLHRQGSKCYVVVGQQPDLEAHRFPAKYELKLKK